MFKVYFYKDGNKEILPEEYETKLKASSWIMWQEELNWVTPNYYIEEV